MHSRKNIQLWQKKEVEVETVRLFPDSTNICIDWRSRVRMRQNYKKIKRERDCALACLWGENTITLSISWSIVKAQVPSWNSGPSSSKVWLSTSFPFLCIILAVFLGTWHVIAWGSSRSWKILGKQSKTGRFEHQWLKSAAGPGDWPSRAQVAFRGHLSVRCSSFKLLSHQPSSLLSQETQ